MAREEEEVKVDREDAATKERRAAVGPKADAVILDAAANKTIVQARRVTFMVR